MNMADIRIYDSIVNEKIKNEMKDTAWCTDLIQYATFRCKIDGLIASAYLFCPEIIKIDDYIFIKHFWNCSEDKSAECIGRLEEQYDNNKKGY